MAFTLLKICQRAVRRIPGFAVPDSIVSNTEDDVAQRLWECAQDTGEELARDHNWQTLLVKDYTFATVASQADYDLPGNYRRHVNQSSWDRSNQWPLRGPMTGLEYQTLKSGIVPAGIRYWFRLAGDKFTVYPTPTEVYTFAFDYFKDTWCESSGGTGQTEWLSDSDVSRLPDHLMILGTRYYFKRSQGLPYEDDETDYYNQISSAKFDDTPKPVINMGSPGLTGDYPGLPETGFGS